MTHEYHTISVKFTGSGARSYCLARGCNWMSQQHNGFPPYTYAMAWQKAKDDGRRHTAEEQRRAQRARSGNP